MNAADRITAALATLRSDLVSLRSQDVDLMKQLVGINKTISSMRKGSPSRTNSFSASLSSIEDVSSSSEDLSSGSESDDGSTSSNCSLCTRRSRTFIRDDQKSTTSEINYEDILKRNIKVWKHSKSISSQSLDSVFSDDDES